MRKLGIPTLALFLCGCAQFQAKMEQQSALKTALIAAGTALLVGAYEHNRDNDPQPMQKIPKDVCKENRQECR